MKGLLSVPQHPQGREMDLLEEKGTKQEGRAIDRKQARRKQVQHEVEGQRQRQELAVLGSDTTVEIVQNGNALSQSESTPTSTPSGSILLDTPAALQNQQTHHRIVRRASSSTTADTPVIIGVLVGGLAFLAIMIAAYFIWRRRDSRARAAVRTTKVAPSYDDSSPKTMHGIDDKSEFTLPPPAHVRTSSVPRYTPFIHPISPTPVPAESTINRHQSWSQTQHEEQSMFGVPSITPALTLNTKIPTRATKSPSPSMSSRRTSSIFKRLGSRDLASPVSIQSVSTARGPAPPRPPRPEEVAEADGMPQAVFELSASPSVKRKKRGSKPLPVLPTFLLREQEEELKKRRMEEEKERREEYEKLRNPQSPTIPTTFDEVVLEKPTSISPPTSRASNMPRRIGSIDGGIDTQSIGTVLRKSSSLDSLSSSTTSSTSSSADSDDEHPRRPTPEVNALSPRSSQGKSARALSDPTSKPVIPQSPELKNLHAELNSPTLGHRVRTGSNVVEASAVTPGTFPSPKMQPLKVTPPTFSRSSTPESKTSNFGMSPPPISATVASPPTSVLTGYPVYMNSRNNSPEVKTGSTHTASTNSSAIIITGLDHVGSEPYLVIEDEKSDLAASAIEDWRESVGDGYAATRPTTAGATPGGGTSTEDALTWTLPAFVIQDIPSPPPQRPSAPRKISVDTGVGGIPISSNNGTNGVSSSLLSAITPSTNNSLSPYPHYDAVPISAVQAPVGNSHAILRPSTPERQREMRVEMEKARLRAELEARNKAEEKKGYDVMSWMNFDDDSDSAAEEAGPSRKR